MHVATLLKPEMFDIEIDGVPSAISDVFPSSMRMTASAS